MLFLFWVPPVVAAPTALQARAQRVLDRWLRSSVLRGREVGVAVVSLRDGARLASKNADRRLNPASVAKLLTTVAALKTFPPGTRWSTSVHGTLTAGRVDRLIIVGGGDPKLLYPDILGLAASLKAKGVRRVGGGILVDARRFDRVNLPPAFGQKSTTAGYRASIGAAGSEFGAITLRIRPSRSGEGPARVRLKPWRSGIQLVNRSRTVADGETQLTVKAVGRSDGRTKITVEGTVSRDARRIVKRVRVSDVNLFTAHLLRHALRRAGVRVAGPIRYGKRTTEPRLAVHEGASLMAHLRDINVYSNNFMAETVFKQLGVRAGGGPGTWKAAQRRVAAVLRQLGVPANRFRVVNGSGLYRATMVSAGAMASLLAKVARDPTLGPRLRRTLPLSGRHGSLKDRMRGWMKGRVAAKTGTLDDVVSLAGLVRGRRHALGFAIFINRATPRVTLRLRRAIDRLVKRLARL